MAIFGKGRGEDYDDEDELVEEEKEDRKLTKKFRDLNPKNKRKRKEPPKPWGKKERLVVILVLLSTIIISAVLAISRGSRGFSFSGFSFPKLDFDSLNPFKEETIIIEKK